MNIKLIKIGNSRGIRIPNTILKQYEINNELDLEIIDGRLILKPIKKVRKGWDKAFKKMHQLGDDKLTINDTIDLDDKDWIW